MNSKETGTPGHNEEIVGASELFLLRVWLANVAGEDDWHGKVQHAVTGEARNFENSAELKRLVLQMIRKVG